MATTAATLAEHVRNLAAERPADVFAKFLFRGAEPVTITYEGLLREASRFANFYASREVRKQDVVLIILDHSPDVIYAHVGAMLLGAIPSLLPFPSDKVPANVYWEQLRLIFGLCQPRLVLTYDPLLDRLESDRGHGYLGAIERASEANDHPSEIDPVPLSPDDVAVLQHSSGTTGMKKGVALSHRSVLNELRNYAAALELRDTDHIVSWAPLYHDMGLMAGYLLPLCAGIRLTLVSTFEWLGRPAMFLEAISKERGTVCWMPNFAYAFMAKTVPDEGLQGVDLTSLRALINAGEPISDENHQAFFERFKRYGLRASALATAYGMAENTLAVTQGGIATPLKVLEVDSELFSRTGRAAPAQSDTRKRRRLVSSGTLLPNNEVRIVGDSGAPTDDGCLGEIWVRSDSLMRGYYRRPDLDEEAFSEGWYRTGDLGFLLDGELFVTGRKKDMMIIAGKNIYPQDVDEIASAVPGVYPGRVVAFSVPNEDLGTEDVVIMAETLLKDERQRWELKMKVSVAVWQRLECAVTEVVLCDHMTLQKSSSGKISRPANRELYLRGRDGGGRPAKKSKHYKLADRASRAEDTLVRVGDLLIGGAGFTVMAGPCAVESADQISRTAQFVREHGAHVLRGGVFKPRTSPYAFQGLGYDGLELLASAGHSAGLPIITEVMAPEQVRAIAEKADILQIGARNMQNFDLLRAVGKVYRPVLLKRGLSSTIEEWLAAAEYILAQGNGQVILCERGIRTFESATRNTLDLSAVVVLRERTHLPVIVDPSHGTGKRSYVAPMAYAARACGAHGLLIEVHPDPEHALSDGDQSLTFTEFAALMEGLARQRK